MEGPNESSDRRTLLLVIAGAVVAVAAAIAFLRPSSEVTVLGPAPDVEGTDSAHPIVVQVRSSGGFSLFGLTFSSPDHHVSVGFSAPAECRAVLDGDPEFWPTGDSRCGAPGAVGGTISGDGIAADGRALVFVEFAVPDDCFDAVVQGQIWPPEAPGCPSSR